MMMLTTEMERENISHELVFPVWPDPSLKIFHDAAENSGLRERALKRRSMNMQGRVSQCFFVLMMVVDSVSFMYFSFVHSPLPSWELGFSYT